jgi:hypothetical protein
MANVWPRVLRLAAPPVVVRAVSAEEATLAAMKQYLRAANRLERRALEADNLGRPILARRCRAQAARLRSAANAERVDAKPAGLDR